MTTTQTHAKLVKIAQDQLDIANGEQAGTAGPQEVVDALTEVIDDLTAVAEAVPAEPSVDQGIDATQPDVSPEVPAEDPAAQPPIESEEEKIARIRKAAEHDDDDDKDKDAKIAVLSEQVSKLNAHIAKEQLAKVAEEYSVAIHNDTRSQQAKFDEVMASNKPSEYWTARLDAINEFTNANNVNTQFAKPAKNFTAYRVAKLGKKTQIGEMNL